MQVEYTLVRELRPYANNARTHSKKQIQQIAQSIKKFGSCNPVLIDDKGQIIAGHGRVEAAKLLGLHAVPTVRLSHLSEADKRAYVLADNKLAQKAGWDREILAIELQGLIDLNVEVELTGFEMAEVDVLLDEAQEAKGPAAGPEDDVPDCTPGDDGSIHQICMDWRHMGEMLTAGRAIYGELKNLCVWNKSNAGMGTFYRSKHEFVFVWKNGSAPHINNFELGQHGRNRTNVWDYPGISTMRKGRLEELAMHPTVKPVALVADAIKDCSRRG